MGDAFLLEEGNGVPVNLKVVGVGGGGCNAVSNMVDANIKGVEFIAVNTDLKSLRACKAPIKIQIGSKLTKGLGAGSDPEVGKKAALEDRELLAEHLKGADMVFITCGLGGGTGTGASPVVAEVAKELGALTVAVATKPFAFEGHVRMRQAEKGIQELKSRVDSLIIIPNQRLMSIGGRHMTIIEAFLRADEVLMNAVRSISDLIFGSGHVVVDFADVKTIMAQKGMAIMGVGEAQGENRAKEAAQKAIYSPLLEDVSIDGAKGVLINITGNRDLTLHEVNEASTMIQEQAHPEAKVIWGLVFDESIGEKVRVTVIATGFEDKQDLKVETREDAKGFGLFSAEDFPYFARRGQTEFRKGRSSKEDQVESRLEIPTFLRKQAD